MYEVFYGLTGKPFQLNPDPSFYFGSKQHQRAMSYLEYGLHQNEGFIVITGEIGAGKTTIVRNLFSQLNSNEVVAANLVTTQLDADDMLRMVAAAFGIPSKQSDKSQLLLSVEAFLLSIAQQGKRCLLVVDEAQNLTPRAIEELRMLSNFQLETHALLQSFLVGQPEFRETLQSPEMEQLRQRVIAACHIGPLGGSETRGYIEHRLGKVGWKGNPEFRPDAYEAIFEATGGVPRRINSVCDRLLWYGYLADKRTFGRSDVEEVADEMHDEARSAKNSKTRRTTDSVTGTAIPIAAEHQVIAARDVVSGPDNSSTMPTVHGAGSLRVEEQLRNINEGINRMDATMQRIERHNMVSTAMFRRLLDWMRSRETEREKSP